MRRLNLWLLALAATIPGAAAGGCAADNPNSMIILGNTAPGAMCTFSASESGPFLFHGVLDLNRASSYVVVPTVFSGQQIMAGEPQTAGIITFSGAHVEISGVNSQDSLTVVEALGADNTVRDPEDCAGAVDPNGGLGICSVTVLDVGQVAALNGIVGDQIVPIRATIQVQGEVRGNTVESNTFQYQIDICRGCLIDERAVPCMDIMAELGDSACMLGQDRPAICCQTSATSTACFNPP
jgi:hypothetical protein